MCVGVKRGHDTGVVKEAHGAGGRSDLATRWDLATPCDLATRWDLCKDLAAAPTVAYFKGYGAKEREKQSQ